MYKALSLFGAIWKLTVPLDYLLAVIQLMVIGPNTITISNHVNNHANPITGLRGFPGRLACYHNQPPENQGPPNNWKCKSNEPATVSETRFYCALILYVTLKHHLDTAKSLPRAMGAKIECHLVLATQESMMSACRRFFNAVTLSHQRQNHVSKKERPVWESSAALLKMKAN
ncbi:hypothetical protein EVAR_32900_1 [Eumeta japonica]|uniref:Uncharacterized protein n=1 Tax=Eumeta variegata TaxID=151549 RepID=A0A4C1VPN2_EUMVA|nr:hypothetical protein EVAR_32900_1 [Eumeta japonica]